MIDFEHKLRKMGKIKADTLYTFFKIENLKTYGLTELTYTSENLFGVKNRKARAITVKTYDGLEVRIDNQPDLILEYVANGKWMVHTHE